MTSRVLGHAGIGSQFRHSAGTGQIATVLRNFLWVKLDGLARIAKCLVDIVAGRETTGQVGKPNPNRLLRTRILTMAT